MSDTTGATWKVVSQQPRTDVGANGQLEQGYTVTYLTGNGHTGTVFVPMARYNPDTVKAMIQEQANLLDAVGALTNES